MPSSATITAFYTFTTLTKIKSSEANSNWSLLRGHLIPIDGSLTAAANNSYDLGSSEYYWRNLYVTTLNIGKPDGFDPQQGTSFVIANSQGTTTTVTNFLINSATYTSAEYFCEIKRGTTYMGNQSYYLQYINSAWTMTAGPIYGSLHGVTLYCVNTGTSAQIQYTSDNKGAGTLKFKKVGFYV